MHPTLQHFLRQLVGAILVASVPAILVAFLGMPLNLGRHPGEVAPLSAQSTLVARHLS